MCGAEPGHWCTAQGGGREISKGDQIPHPHPERVEQADKKKRSLWCAAGRCSGAWSMTARKGRTGATPVTCEAAGAARIPTGPLLLRPVAEEEAR